jgi:hypothetical protein
MEDDPIAKSVPLQNVARHPVTAAGSLDTLLRMEMQQI